METKYYTPAIEEFHVGFEFEFAGLDGYSNILPFEKAKILTEEESKKTGYNGLYTLEWVDKMFQPPHLVISYKDLLRVKYLDHEDIEACGWKDYKGEFLTINEDYFLEYDETHHYVRIVTNYTYPDDFTIFSGTIRNKSELRRVMKMLNIE